MDTIPVIAHWPKYPYRGLDFYREADALLFRERDADIRECSAILLGFGVKILLLQGSSGSGKSSFLRAGLIPHLKRSERRNFFLSSRDSVIRCTSDPLREIARSLLDTFGNEDTSGDRAGFAGDVGRGGLAELVASQQVCSDIEQALVAPRDHLAEALVQALVEVCSDLSGKLILVLDQAEEVLTRTGERAADAAGAFFRFLEGIYLRNVDVRVVVALRTEYYGRFRDELRISDDRLGKRPRSGGVEPYLLRSLRERSALLAIVNAPTQAQRGDGTPVYNFAFEAGLAEQIVDDLLRIFQYASVTPALQVVCSILHERLTDKNRTITRAEYVKRGEIIGIVDDYLMRGIAAAGARTKAQRNQWGELLHTLVSRQGGGTLASLIESRERLEEAARELGIRGEIGPALVKLTSGATPLLRGEPPEDPGNFSLKHDVLAVVLSRWYAEHEGAVKATKAMKRWALIAALVLLMIGGSVAWGVFQRAEEVLQNQARSVRLTDQHALRAPEGNFRQSLLLTLANLDATAPPRDPLERLVNDKSQIHRQTLQALRTILSRAPWFAGHFRAAGVDPASDRIALLAIGQRALLVLTLPPGGAETAEPSLKTYELPEEAGQVSSLRPAAGFVTGLGPVALAGGDAFYWDDRGERQKCVLVQSLPAKITARSWIRADFNGGELQISTAERHNLTSSLQILELDAAHLRACSSAIPGAISGAKMVQVPPRPFSQPVPVFADTPSLPEAYEYLEGISKSVPGELAASVPKDPTRSDPGSPLELDAVVSLPERGSQPFRIAVGQVSPERGIPERLHYTIAFAANAEAMAFKFDGPNFYIYDLTQVRPGYVDVKPQPIAVDSVRSADAWRLESARIPWVYPPLAAARVGNHWRAAWLATDGVWVVESSDQDAGSARPIGDNQLIGEPDGSKLQFTGDGQFLMLERTQFGLPVAVRIWDLNSTWRQWLADPKTNEEELRRVACRIVRMDGLGAFDEADIELFQIDPDHREPCPKPTGAKS